MIRTITESLVANHPEFSDKVWLDVLSAVDQTYADLVDYQEKLERQNAELEGLRAFLASVLASVSDVLIVVSRSGLVEECSASLYGHVGRPAGTLAGLPVVDLLADDDRAALATAMQRATDQRAPVTAELSLRTPDGSTPVDFILSPRFDDRARVAGLVMTGRPVGELRQAYAALERSHDDLKQAQAQLVRNEKLASLGRLLAGVAHELNNPISFVYANAHALERYAGKFETYFARVQEGASREELVSLREDLRLDREVRNLRDAVRGAREGAERVRDIVEDLRRLSADGAGELVGFDLVETARIAASWVLRGSKRSVDIAFDGLPALMARGRPGHIQQVVMNLVQNAVDALEETTDGRIRVTVEREGARAVLTVADNGPGVGQDAAAAIFDPFFTTKPVGRGTGLGLSISHKIIEEHGGSLRLLAGPPPGAAFRFDLAAEEGRS